MYYICDNPDCEHEQYLPEYDEFDEEDNPAPEKKCEECGADTTFDYGAYESSSELKADMEDMMFPEGRDDGFNVDKHFGLD